MPKQKMKTLRLILGDQLNYRHSWFSRVQENVYYVLMEVREETDYVTHHIQKVIAIFAAMYNFSRFLQKGGHRVIYLQINDKENTQSLKGNIQRLISEHSFEKFEYLLPDEYRVDEELKNICKELKIPSAFFDTEHFLTQRFELKTFFEGKKTFLMESFYRHMRKKHGILMVKESPYGDTWNYDSANRKPYKGEIKIPQELQFHHNYLSIEQEIKKAGVKTIGLSYSDNFPWPTTRKEAVELMNYFCDHLLPYFGQFQDAMHSKQRFLFHSRLSFALNIKLISPLELIKCIENRFYSHPEHASIEQVEGFIRQVLGWREYMRGIYWAQMPEYKQLNFFNHQNPLPNWFWTGNTNMNCLKHVVTQSLQDAYAHHIQRLMVTGNFALLAQTNPNEVDQWYLGIYIDAFEWVEITNTRGMSQYADGGMVGSKPYISSAAYIDKMSNYCKTCFYDKTKKTGERACPFNSLYWYFYETHRKKLVQNPRIGMMYKILDKMSKEARRDIIKQSEKLLANIHAL